MSNFRPKRTFLSPPTHRPVEFPTGAEFRAQLMELQIVRTNDAAPTEAGAVPGTSVPSDHACILSTCWPR
jgi:hypothetical protein